VADKPRRTPRQTRSAATVEAILEAAFQVLEADGAAGLNTNAVAARAGVSVGSIYQYFGNKDDILAGLARREAESARAAIARQVARLPAGGARAVVRALIGAFRGRRETRLALLDAFLRQGGARSLAPFDPPLMSEARGRLRAADARLSPEAMFVLTRALPSLLRAAMFEAELEMSPARLEDELVRLIEAYVAALATSR
jgi:AcrR family transcriptional regulator